MHNKPNARRWADVQIIIAAISMTVTLALWNLFSAAARAGEVAAASGDGNQATPPPEVDPTALPTLPPTPMQPVRILLGGSAPGAIQSLAPAQGSAPQPARKKPKPKKGGGGGGGVTRTRSS